MGSWFDAVYGDHGLPQLMRFNGTQAVVSIIEDTGEMLVENASAIVSARRDEEVVADGGLVKKMRTASVIVSTETTAIDWKSWPNDRLFKCFAVLDGVTWSINEVEGRTPSTLRLKLAKSMPHEQTIPGVRQEQ